MFSTSHSTYTHQIENHRKDGNMNQSVYKLIKVLKYKLNKFKIDYPEKEPYVVIRVIENKKNISETKCATLIEENIVNLKIEYEKKHIELNEIKNKSEDLLNQLINNKNNINVKTSRKIVHKLEDDFSKIKHQLELLTNCASEQITFVKKTTEPTCITYNEIEIKDDIEFCDYDSLVKEKEIWKNKVILLQNDINTHYKPKVGRKPILQKTRVSYIEISENKSYYPTVTIKPIQTICLKCVKTESLSEISTKLKYHYKYPYDDYDDDGVISE